MVPQMLTAVNLAATALHDGVGPLAAGFEGAAFVHLCVSTSYIFQEGKYPFYITGDK
jgi:hypothetical protein